MNTPEDDSKKTSGLLTGIIVGGAVGSVISLLFATDKGRKTGKHFTRKFFGKSKSTAEKFLDKWKK